MIGVLKSKKRNSELSCVLFPLVRFTAKPSHEFLSLIDGLLQKDLDKR